MAAEAPEAAPPSPRESALSAALIALQPLVSLLLDAGASSQQAAHLVKWAFVREAASRLTSPNRRPSASRIAAATGLSRADVRELLRNSALDSKSAHWAPRAADSVLAGWTTDPDFLNPSGTPRALAYAPSPTGFAELVRRYARDIPPRAMLNELLDTRLAIEVGPDRYLPVLPTPRESLSRRTALSGFGTKLASLGGTLLQNLREDNGPPAFDTLLLANRVPAHKRAKVLRDLTRRSRTFAKGIERYLMDQTSDVDPQTDDDLEQQPVGIVLAVVDSRDCHEVDAAIGKQNHDT